MVNNLIIDFDSTILSVEVMEHLFNVSLSRNPRRLEILDEAVRITRAGIAGEIPYSESLSRRIALLPIKYSALSKAIEGLEEEFSESFIDSVDSLKEYNLHFVSCAFREVIEPLLQPYGIESNQIHANSLVFEGDELVGVDQTIPLAHNQGKVKTIEDLGLDGTTVIVGDGYTDYEVKESDSVDYFVYYAEHVDRPGVIEHADVVVNDFKELLEWMKKVS